MLRINLLPPYIYAGKQKRNVTILWIALFILAVGGFVYWKTTLDKAAADWQNQATTETPAKVAEEKAVTDTAAVVAATKGTKDKSDFVQTANSYVRETYPNLFDNIRDYTIDRVLYDSVVPAGPTVQIAAYAPSLADVGHYMLAMEGNPNVSNIAIAMNSIPSFPVQAGGTNAAAGAGSAGGAQQAAGVRPAGGGGHDFNVTLALVKPVPAAPVFPPGSGAPAGPGGGFGGGAGSGMPGSGTTGSGMTGSGMGSGMKAGGKLGGGMPIN